MQVRSMKSRIFRLVSLCTAATYGLATAAYAVQDLPGGPAVKQLNLHPPVTRIAQEQHFLHWMMLSICVLIFVGVLEKVTDDFGAVSWQPQMEGGKAGRELPGIVDQVISMSLFAREEDGTLRHDPERGTERRGSRKSSAA